MAKHQRQNHSESIHDVLNILVRYTHLCGKSIVKSRMIRKVLRTLDNSYEGNAVT